MIPKRKERLAFDDKPVPSQRVLSEWPLETLVIACTRCERFVRYNRDKLLAEGGDRGLVDLLNEIQADCPHYRWNKEHIGFAKLPCGAHYADALRLAGRSEVTDEAGPAMLPSMLR